MRILFVSIGPWNDIQYGNNILTNWFSDFSCESAQVYTHPGFPYNNICTKYYHITDEMMFQSLTRDPAGVCYELDKEEQSRIQEKAGLHVIDSGLSSRAKKLPTNLINIMRDALWIVGRVDKASLRKFVQDFEPDIVFCSHLFDIKFYKIERLIKEYTNAPFVAFTGDSEISLRKNSISPLFWLRNFATRILFKRHIKIFSHYFTFCEEQAKWYEKLSGVPSSTLYKCSDFSNSFSPKPVGNPIHLVYAGNIIYNRWKTLAAIADAIEIINSTSDKMILDIFTNTPMTQKMSRRLLGRPGVNVHDRIAPSKLVEVYNKADIALHIESFTRKYRLETKDSFSTKIVDLMNSSCAIIAICWKEHNALKYLLREDAAICVSDLKNIEPTLRKLCNNPSIIQEYACKAWECGKRNHSKNVIQDIIKETFNKAITNKKNEIYRNNNHT